MVLTFNDAVEFVKNNYSKMILDNHVLVSVRYLPGHPDGDFHIYTLEFEIDDEGGWFSSSFMSGWIPEVGFGVEDIFGGRTSEELSKDIGPDVDRLSFFLVKNRDFFGLTTEYTLKRIFSDLPDPDFNDSDDMQEFRTMAISKIKSLNDANM
ncbi:hypothetical protein OEK23_003480 [Vibrio cholerae]|nr:hypothetical protein [Vibrio cholerae]